VFNEEREYIGNISHEILTPISIIRSKLENFSNNTNLSHDDAIKIYETKVTLGRLTKLVRSLLLLSRIENKEYLLDETINIKQVALNVIDEIKERIEVKDISLTEKLSNEEYILFGNKELIHILIYNILNNAIKYTPENGKIELSSNSINSSYVLEIKDNGIGIAEKDLPHVFERFKKFESGTHNFGLGLALSKKICDYHQIEIQVESKLDYGSTFTLIFPKKK